ncbi:MAG: hypothetical protein HY327_05020 [Chloroflexi bacterium]|nr:hypothetical protein [Chloroflexota bacterium]
MSLARLHARQDGYSAFPIASVPFAQFEFSADQVQIVVTELLEPLSTALFQGRERGDASEIVQPSSPYTDVDSEEVFQSLANEKGWGDGLPLVVPRQDRVDVIFERSRIDPEQIVAVVPPRRGRLTLRYLAANAIMAGCTTDSLPALSAAIQAACDPRFQLGSLLSTTSPATTLAIFNGPIVNQLGLNSGTRALGAGNRANATLGRAVRLALRNAGGEAGATGKSTLGQPGDYAFCFAENELASPWPPLSVDQGIAPGQSAVTIVASAGFCEIRDSVSSDAENLLFTLAHSIALAGLVGPSGTAMINGHLTLVLSPDHARILGNAGLSRQAVQQWIWEHACVRADQLSPANRRNLEITRSSRGLPAIFEQLPVTETPRYILIAVAGGIGTKSAFVPGWGSCLAVTYPIIEL